jgi:NTE family protein
MTHKTINLALQGGGAHGAYTWGVLDRLLEEETLSIEGISGTSAGAMNAAMLVNGYMHNGRDGAKQYMETFWHRISESAAYSPLHKSPMERMMTGWNMDYSPAYYMFDVMSRLFSPYMLNPLNINPMRYILDDMIDLDAMRSCSLIRLFIAATHVESGQVRIFQCDELSTDVLLASACIPFMFQAIEIEGEHYWDGGYMGNPAIWPLIYQCSSPDIMLVQINPIHHDKLPKTAHDIINRLNEISFNSSLIAEMRAIDFVSRLIEKGSLSEDEYKKVRMHLIYSPTHMHNLNASSKVNADWDFFRYLRDIGRKSAEDWIKAHWKDIGVRSSVNIREKFLCKPKTLHVTPEPNTGPAGPQGAGKHTPKKKTKA